MHEIHVETLKYTCISYTKHNVNTQHIQLNRKYLWVFFVWNKHDRLTQWLIWFYSKSKELRLRTHSRQNSRSTAVLRIENALTRITLSACTHCIYGTDMHIAFADTHACSWLEATTRAIKQKTAETQRTRHRQITNSSCARKIIKLRPLFYYTPLMLLWQPAQLFWDETFITVGSIKATKSTITRYSSNTNVCTCTSP